MTRRTPLSGPEVSAADVAGVDPAPPIDPVEALRLDLDDLLDAPGPEARGALVWNAFTNQGLAAMAEEYGFSGMALPRLLTSDAARMVGDMGSLPEIRRVTELVLQLPGDSRPAVMGALLESGRVATVLSEERGPADLALLSAARAEMPAASRGGDWRAYLGPDASRPSSGGSGRALSR